MPAITRRLNDPRATRLTGPGRHEGTDMSHDTAKVIEDDRGDVVTFGRGTTDPRITWSAQRNTNGELVYSYPNAAGNGTITTLVHP